MIDSQIAELRRFAHERGWQVVDIYRDEGWSGSLLARPELDRLRDDAAKNLFSLVLINDVDRLARDVTHLGVIKRDLERCGVQVIFRKLPAEQSPTHNLMVNILGSFAEFEREHIADRFRRGKRHRVEVRKLYIGSIPPYGFRYIRKDRATRTDGMLQVNHEEAAVVSQMYAWVDEEGLSARQVMNRLNEMGLLPRKGAAAWAKSSVLRILRSEVYQGVWHYNKHEACIPTIVQRNAKYKKSLKSSRRLRQRCEWLPVALPEGLRLVSPDQWRRVQIQISRNVAFSPRNEKHVYFLKGLVRCAGCAAICVGDPGHGKFYYRCMRRCKKIPTVLEDRLNNVVWAAVEKAILNPDLIADQVTKLGRKRTTQVSQMENDAVDADQALLQIRNEEARLIEAYRVEILSPAQLGQELEKVKLRKISFHKRKTEISDKVHRLSPPAVKKSVADYCKIAAARLKSFGPEDRRRFLRVLLREIMFDGASVRIKGVIPISKDGKEANSRQGNRGPGEEIDCGIATTTSADYGHNLGSIASTTSQDYGPKPDSIAGTTSKGHSLNPTSGFADLFAPKREANTDDYFTFELVQPVPRPIHSRTYLRQNDTQEDGTTSQLAA